MSPEHKNTRTPRGRAREAGPLGDDELAVSVNDVEAAVALLAERGIRHRASFVAGSRCREFLEAGGTLDELGRLADLAELAARGDGLVWHWLADASRWREVLVDAERRRSESRRRRAATQALASEGAGPGSRRWAPSTPADALGNRAPWLRVRRSGAPTPYASTLTPAAAQGRTERRARAVGS